MYKKHIIYNLDYKINILKLFCNSYTMLVIYLFTNLCKDNQNVLFPIVDHNETAIICDDNQNVLFPLVEHNETAIISQAIWKNSPKAVIGENATLQCIFSGMWVAPFLLMKIHT